MAGNNLPQEAYAKIIFDLCSLCGFLVISVFNYYRGDNKELPKTTRR